MEENKTKLLDEKQKLTRGAGIILLIGACGLLLARILAYFISEPLENAFEDKGYGELMLELVFDVIVQIVFLLGSSYAVSRLYLKKTNKEFLEISNVKRVSPLVCLVAVGIGLFAPALSYAVNLIVNSAFLTIGVRLPASSSVYPEEFSVWVLLVYIVLTAVLPAVCEEVFNRGVVLTSMRSMFNEWQTVLLGGLVFGLFHQYIFQTFYTGVFGMLLVYVTLKTKSIIPAVIAHFTNNAAAIISDFAAYYNFDFLSLSSLIVKVADNIVLLISCIAFAIVILGLLTYLLVRLDKKSKDAEIIKRFHLEDKVKEGNISIDVLGGPLGDTVYYKPTAKDTACWWGAFAAALACTVCSMFWYLL